MPEDRQGSVFFAPPMKPKDGIADARASFQEITKRTPRNPAGESAFLAAKLHMVLTHPTLSPAARRTLSPVFQSQAAIMHAGPTPGGVGYGMFYNEPFKSLWTTGTALYWEIVCPNPPGGNVNSFLYLTATNRSAKGVEAFVSYNGQNDAHFMVFDWARPDSEHWQTNVAFASLGEYLRTESSHGQNFPVFPVMNVTSQSGGNDWYNQVWLWNRIADRWDLIYQYDYSATLADHQTGWVGSWGPIVETFQDSYQGTNPMGALNTQRIACDANNQWSAWRLLSVSDCTIRTDNKGFQLLFLDPNSTWAVTS